MYGWVAGPGRAWRHLKQKSYVHECMCMCVYLCVCVCACAHECVLLVHAMFTSKGGEEAAHRSLNLLLLLLLLCLCQQAVLGVWGGCSVRWCCWMWAQGCDRRGQTHRGYMRSGLGVSSSGQGYLYVGMCECVYVCK
jgi:hypothetical protein